MTARRYGEDQAREIFNLATSADAPDGSPAARAVPVRRSLGLPIGVSRVVDLPRAPTDREWEELVSEFKTTFGGPGRTTASGKLREWAHAYIHICAEPTEQGEQLRFSALHYDAMVFNGLGIVLGIMSILMATALVIAGKPAKAFEILGVFGGIALSPWVVNLVQLPRWTRERERQMETIAEHALKLLSDAQIESPNDD